MLKCFLIIHYSIEGIPLIIRFKTKISLTFWNSSGGIEGIPLITRFKTYPIQQDARLRLQCIEGSPLVTRFLK